MSIDKGNCSGRVADDNAYPISVWAWFFICFKTSQCQESTQVKFQIQLLTQHAVMVTALDTPHYHSEEHNCVSRVSCERKAIERITKFQALKTMNDTNKKKNRGRIQETCVSQNVKKVSMKQHRALTMLQERTVLKLLVFGGGSSLV